MLERKDFKPSRFDLISLQSVLRPFFCYAMYSISPSCHGLLTTLATIANLRATAVFALDSRPRLTQHSLQGEYQAVSRLFMHEKLVSMRPSCARPCPVF